MPTQHCNGQSAEVTALHFELAFQFSKRKWVIIVQSLLGIHPSVQIGHKFHSWAINEKLQAVDIDNALQNCIIVILIGKNIFFLVSWDKSIF